ncbi:ATP-dependent RNA helicase DEAH12, chloroplastic-like [Centruroides sculpturatus]|uniref:ATP-dependent RNA helicase DEAH12, chloroplastic-like n=1 Tax=Centruroides sculpturatus TaxID=218467 RepID=UPI000C6EF76E|nr:ATP-dependent RNA helicase DEAH12, chloroplastic-like [Centruroides sculpturatus]
MSQAKRGNIHANRGRGESHSSRGRGESHSSRGKGECHSSRGRGECHAFRGRGESHSSRGRAESHFSRGGSKTYSSEERDENHSERKRGGIHFNRGRGEKFSFNTKYKKSQNENQKQDNFTYDLYNMKESKKKYKSNENISSYWKQSNENISGSQFELNSFCPFEKKSNKITKNKNSIVNKILDYSEECFDKKTQNLDPSVKKKERKRKHKKNKKINITEQNARSTNIPVNMKIKQRSIPDLLTFVRKFSEKLFEFNDEVESIDDDLENNSNDNIKYEIPKQLKASNSVPDDDDKSEIYDTESESSSYSSDSFDKMDDIETNFNNTISVKPSKKFTINQECYIGVYWDIENCPVPSKKLASDIVKKIRNKFYGNCTEAEFLVSCDIRNINDDIVTDLNDAQVTVVHVDCLNKNAADNKLKVYLRRFADNYRHPNSCIVLISGDCDFVPDLHDLRYRHQINIIVLHNIQAKKNLKDVANFAQEFNEFCKDLPDYQKVQKHIIIQNLPMNKKLKGEIRTFLIDFLKGYNYNYLKINNGNAEVGFKNDKMVKSALSKLNEINLFGNNISAKEIEFQESKELKEVEKNDIIEVEKNNIKEEKSFDSTDDKEFKIILQVEECKNKLFWQQFFKTLFPKTNFQMQNINEQQKLITLAFESLNKSKKALKIINKHRMNEASPKIHNIISDEKENIVKLDNNVEIISKCLKLIDSKSDQSVKLHNTKKEKFFTENPSSFYLPDIDESECRHVTENRLKIMNEQKSEFLSYIKNKKRKVEECSSLSTDICINLTDEIKKEIEHECHLFLSGNPAYSKKSTITNILEKSNICVLHMDNHLYDNSEIGHYLLKTNYAKDGIIVHIKPKMKVSKSFQDDEKAFDFITQKNNSGIISMTDYSFLKYFLRNKNLENIKCIIFDTIEERYLYTEALLLLLRERPINETNFKLLFITNDISAIENYFPVNKEIICDFGKWNYPVNIIWKENNVDIGFNYIQDCVECIMFICENTIITRNILIFLTSVLDIQQAIFLLERFLDRKGIKEFELIQFHEFQDEKEQKEMFSANKDKRKIIFSTDCGRISKLMTSVQCVIDCGFTLKEVYNSCNGSCDIWKKFQSKYSSEMRKSCAGSHGPGICYRLFSKDDYKEKMNDKELSDLYQNDLSHLFLLFLQHEINPFNFNYGKNISVDYLNTFKKKLIQLNAIKDNKLTEIGSEMSKLNFEPSTAKLIIRGYEEGIPFEISTLAALSIISGYISFHQDPIEQTKQWRFNQPNGDWKTFHTMYTEWLSVPKKSKHYWCQLNNININAIKIYHELSNNITLHVSKICKKKNSSDKANCDIKIQKLLLEAYPNNLCCCSDQVNEQYWNAFYPNNLLIHSLTSIKHLGIFPEFIVYQKIFKLSDCFILGVNAIKEEVLLEMERDGKLPVSVNDLKMQMLVSIKISDLSLPLLKSLMGRNKQNLNLIENKVRNIVQDNITRIEINSLKGEIIVHTKQKNVDKVKIFIYEILQNEKEKILNVENEIFIDGYLKNIRLLIGSGMVVKDVMMPNESRNVHIKSNKPLDDILGMLEDNCGKICNYEVNKKGIIVTFEKAAFAENAVNKFSNETNFKILYQTNLDSSFKKPPPLILTMTWFRRPCLGIGFINFESEVELHEMLSKLPTIEIEIKGKKTILQINKKKRDSLSLKNLPETTTAGDIESAIKTLQSDISYKSIIVSRKKAYSSTEDEIEIIKMTLHNIFDKYTNSKELEIDIEKPKESSIVWKATLSFTNILDGFTAIASLKNIPLTGSQIKLDLSLAINCHLKLFYCIKDQLEEAINMFTTGENSNDSLKIVAKPFGDLVSIKIQSNNINDIIKVKSMFCDIIEGQCISDLNETQLNNISLNSGTELIKNLEETFHLYIQTDCIKKKISICGDLQNTKTAKNIINNFLDNSKTYKQFELLRDDIPRGALCAIAKSYGHNLDDLRKSCNLEELKFNFEERLIMVCGTDASIKKFETNLNKLYTKIQKNKELNDELNEICPICCGVKDESFYCLLCCEHVFCKPCLLMQIQYGNLPLICQNKVSGSLFSL